jgi:hypothetical protein
MIYMLRVYQADLENLLLTKRKGVHDLVSKIVLKKDLVSKPTNESVYGCSCST